MPAKKLPTVHRECKNCGASFPLKYPKSKTVFCGRSCFARWSASQPSVRAKISASNSEYWKRNPEKIRASLFSAETLKKRRLTAIKNAKDNPRSFSPESRARISRLVRERGTKPQRISFGTVTAAERRLLDFLGPIAVPQFKIRTGGHPRKDGRPSYYWLDVAIPSLKIDIEADGKTHYGKRKGSDNRRTAFLELLGWRVIRFSNAEIFTDWPSVEARLEEELARRA